MENVYAGVITGKGSFHITCFFEIVGDYIYDPLFELSFSPEIDKEDYEIINEFQNRGIF